MCFGNYSSHCKFHIDEKIERCLFPCQERSLIEKPLKRSGQDIRRTCSQEYSKLNPRASKTDCLPMKLRDSGNAKLSNIKRKQKNKPRTKKTRLVVINLPCNPTDAVYLKKDIEEVCAFERRNNLYLITDKIYVKFVYSKGKHFSAPSNEEFKDRIVTSNGAFQDVCNDWM